jgi:hypothetical protein
MAINSAPINKNKPEALKKAKIKNIAECTIFCFKTTTKELKTKTVENKKNNSSCGLYNAKFIKNDE